VGEKQINTAAYQQNPYQTFESIFQMNENLYRKKAILKLIDYE
jgi:hypothetical protein